MLVIEMKFLVLRSFMLCSVSNISALFGYVVLEVKSTIQVDLHSVIFSSQSKITRQLHRFLRKVSYFPRLVVI